MTSIWGKLNSNLAAIYQDYLYEREHGNPPDTRFRPPVHASGRIHVSMSFSGTLEEIEALGFDTFGYSPGVGEAAGEIELANLERLAGHENVLWLAVATPHKPCIDFSVPHLGASRVWTDPGGAYTGKGIAIGILDSGIDFRHALFRDPTDPTKSRILRIWDQSFDKPGSPPSVDLLHSKEPPLWTATKTFGIEYKNDNIQKVLAEEAAAPKKTSRLVRHRDDSGHGTHTASIAAGSSSDPDLKEFRGVAPEASLIVVRYLESPRTELVPVVDDATRFRTAVNYILNVAREEKMKAVVINASFGGELDAHDGLSPEERVLSQRFADAPGRAFVAAAGNEAGLYTYRRPDETRAEQAVNQHAEITFRSGEKFTLKVEFYSTTAVGTGRDAPCVRIFYPKGSVFSCRVKIPGADAAFPSAALGTAPRPHNVNGWHYAVRHSLWSKPTDHRCNMFEFELARPKKGNFPQGVYEFEMELNANRIGHVYCTPVTEGGFRIFEPVPPNVSIRERFLINSPAGAANVIAVAAYHCRDDGLPLRESSSRGPLVSWDDPPDPKPKPEVAAPGNITWAGRSRHSSKYPWDLVSRVRQGAGTSVSVPHVAGTIALMFQKNPQLTYTDIMEIFKVSVKDTAPVVPEEVGVGRLDAFEAVRQTRLP